MNQVLPRSIRGSLLRPGLKLMEHLSMRLKLALIGLLLIVLAVLLNRRPPPR